MNIEDFYSSIDEDYAEVLNFHKHEKFVLKFLTLFYDDKTLENLKKHIEENNFVDAYRMAHALKGMSRNVGFTRYHKSSSELMILLRDTGYCDKIYILIKEIEKEDKFIKEKLKILLEK